jgi:hypothetical protein
VKAFILSAAGTLIVVPSAASAEGADWYRGGWRAESGAPQVYEFVIEGGRVSGFACTGCADGTTLARVEGTFSEADGLTFAVRHLNLNGTLARQERLRARLEQGKLVVTGGRSRRVMVKDPRGPDAAAFPVAILPPNAPPVKVLSAPAPGGGGGGGPRAAPYEPPAPWRRLTAADIEGVWLGFGFGMNKQYFVIRRDGDRLFGLACGRCDNPYTMGALENFTFEGDTVKFDIKHQDWGEGTRLPFVRHVSAHIAMNELRMDARRDDAPDRPGIVASLLGPVSLEATRGNTVGE